MIIENIVADIDTIVRQVRYTGWNETQEGDRTVRKEVRLILKKYGFADHRGPVRPCLRLHQGELLREPGEFQPAQRHTQAATRMPVPGSVVP